ncbi:protein kinase [Caenimonas sedimenti]|uniref:non-specific serine/threonine protein kinase n=1 Tax=Caenimonas sedimenti TaxID=2596921 RepID=A0A562ZYF6_9BURK|nr:serine/threonine-protein kinase [Caenimonas sedimenti]TWO73418.1 protein kinase [Caenimonas sedimenti]
MSAAFSHFGRYRVVGEIGRGAMGVVYEAEDETLQRQVAVKTMLLSDDAEERAGHEARFRQEAKAAAGLNHPNVITVYDMGREGDWLYIAMEMLRGQELRELMNSGTLQLPVIVDLISQVASGLAAAHMRGIVHRDIKPSNIMVMDGRHAKIMDFGVARMQISEVKTQTGVMLGSPKYMAPEQVEGRGVDSRSDIFSLGSVLYECVAGSAPFSGTDLGTLLFDIVHGQPVPPSKRNPAVPEELDRIVARALRKDPGARYQDADLLAHELAQCAAHLMSGAVRAGSFSPAATISRRLPFTEAPAQPVPVPAAGDDPEATVAQVRKRAPDAYESTQQISAAPDSVAPPESAPPEQEATLGRTASEAGDGKPRRASFPLAVEFDSIAALQRLATGAASAEPPPQALPVRTVAGAPRWAWPVAFGVAVFAALAIAFV